MIQRDEDGEPWLLCDLCVAACAHDGESRYHDPQINSFNGIGLFSASQIRGCAKSLEGWRRRKLIICMDPLRSAWFDLCPACQQPEILTMRLIGSSVIHSFATEKP